MNLHDLSGKTALVTGAAHPEGIGRAIAETLGKSGARIVVADIDRENMEGSVNDLQQMGISASAYDMDVSNPDQVNEIMQQILQEVGAIQILINNVGGSSRITREEMEGGWTGGKMPGDGKSLLGVANATLEQWHKILDVNLNSAFYCTRALLPQMVQQRYGRIVNFASIVGQRGVLKTETFSSGPYAVSKAGVIGFTRQLALEVAEYGITVNAIAPGYIRSGRGKRIADLPTEQRSPLMDSIPMGRLGETEEIGNIVLGLCGMQFAYVTGQTINVNGGMYFS